MAKSKTSVVNEPGVCVAIYVDPFNKRIRIDHYDGDVNQMIALAVVRARSEQAEKLIIKGKKEDFLRFLEKDFSLEAVIDGYFLGDDAYLFCKYFTIERKHSDHILIEMDIVEKVQAIPLQQSNQLMKQEPYPLVRITDKDAERLAHLYRAVFPVYPTPLFDPDYIKETLSRGTIYYAHEHQGQFISAASAEIETTFHNAELTDCATLKEFRKFGLMKLLLERLEKELSERRIFCAYSIARARSFGMNAVLRQLGYCYRGRLTNNCVIFEKLEDMNVWVKDLSRARLDKK